MIFADVFIQRTAESVGDVVFSVGKSTCTAETAHNGTALAVNAALDLISIDGTVALLQRMTGFEDGDLLHHDGPREEEYRFEVGILLYQLVSGEDTAGAGTDNNDVIFHRE